MEGGKYIGKGAFACVFQGPLLCKKKQLSKAGVGKITAREDVVPELHAYTVLHKIDEVNNYFIISNSACTPRELEEQVDPEVKKCHLLNNTKLGDLAQLGMPYGGIKLSTLHLRGNNRVNFFILMRQLLEAGSLMLLHGFVHYDIHYGNIIIDKYNTPRIIDYGQSFSIDQISDETIGDRRKEIDPSHPVEPPEITFLTCITKGYTFEETLINIIPNKLVLYKIEKILGTSVKKQIASLATFLKNSNAFLTHDNVKFWKLYYPAFDSWSIGVLLLQYLEKFFISYEFTESSEWKLKHVIIYDVLRKMTLANPKDRIDCVEALNMLDPFNDIYLKYGVKWLTAKKIQRRK